MEMEMESILTKDQIKKFTKVYRENGNTYRITAIVRHDDNCGNGYNTFSITGDIYRKANNGRWIGECFGCIHDYISLHFPQLKPFIKFHLCSTNGPLHYIANTIYWAKQKNFDYARKSAIWNVPDSFFYPYFTNEEGNKVLDIGTLEYRLRSQLPKLLHEFKNMVELFGFVY